MATGGGCKAATVIVGWHSASGQIIVIDLTGMSDAIDTAGIAGIHDYPG